MRNQSRQCRAKTKEGIRCRSIALPNSDYCYFHDPSKAEERKAAHVRGGKQGLYRVLEKAPDVSLKSCADIVQLICETVSQVRRGELDPKIANSVGYLANVAVRALETGDIEERVQALEDAIKKQENRRSRHG